MKNLKNNLILKGGLIGGFVGAFFPIIPFILGPFYLGWVNPDAIFFWITVVMPLGLIQTLFGASFVSGPNKNLFLMLITLNIFYFLIGMVIGGLFGFVINKLRK